MPSLNDVQVKVSTTADNSGIKDATSGLSDMVDNFQSGMKKISAVTAVAGAALTAFSKSSVDYLKDVVSSSKSLAQQTGMTIEQSSQLLAVMGKLGISTTQTSTAFKTFSKNIADSRDNASANAEKVADMNNKIQAAQIQIKTYTDQITKNGDATGALHNKIDALNIAIDGYKKNLDSSIDTLDKLGVVTTDATGNNKDFNTILLEVADKFHDMPDGVEKTADALSLFGKSGLQMIKILDKGSQGIQDLEAQATKLGLTLTAQNVGVISDYIASQKKLADSTNSIKIQVGTLTAPLMTRFNDALNTAVQKLVGMDSPMRNVTADVLAFGGPVLGATSGVAAFAGNVSSALPLLKSMGSLLGNPIFWIFVAVVAAIGVGIYELRQHLGSWHEVMLRLNEVLNVFMPSVQALANTIETNFVPQLERLWEMAGPVLGPALKDLAIVLGVTLVASIWIFINVLRVVIDVLSFTNHVWLDYAQWSINAWNWIVQTWNNAAGYFWGIFNSLRNLGGIINDALTAPFRQAYDGILSIFRNLPRDLGNIVSGAFGNVSNAAKSELHSLHIPGFASGGYTGYGNSGDVAGIVHKGEYVLPQSAVDQRTGQPKGMGGGTVSITIQQLVLPSVTDKASFIASLDQDTLLMGKGLTPNRGMF